MYVCVATAMCISTAVTVFGVMIGVDDHTVCYVLCMMYAVAVLGKNIWGGLAPHDLGGNNV